LAMTGRMKLTVLKEAMVERKREKLEEENLEVFYTRDGRG
jgi:hypothetical protein